MNDFKELSILIEKDLLPNIDMLSKKGKPLKVIIKTKSWICLGTGNYAAVFYHKNFYKYAIKVYRQINENYKNKDCGINEEIQVYKMLQNTKGYYFAKLYFYGRNYIVIDRIPGFTLYDCLNYGIRISEKSIERVDKAINYLRQLNLSPHDIHFKNIIQTENSIVIIDVSDFLNFEYCHLWNSSKKFLSLYNKIPVFPVPKIILEFVRVMYKKVYIFKSKYFQGS